MDSLLTKFAFNLNKPRREATQQPEWDTEAERFDKPRLEATQQPGWDTGAERFDKPSRKAT